MYGLEAKYCAIRRALDCRGWDYRTLGAKVNYSEAAIKRYMARIKDGLPGSRFVGEAIDAALGGVICDEKERRRRS